MAENSDVVKVAEKLIETNTEVTRDEIDARDAKIDELTKELDKVKGERDAAIKERDEATNTLTSMNVKDEEELDEFDQIFKEKKGD